LRPSWKVIVLVNVGGLIGVGISLFTVPPRTPLWLWATLSGLVLVIFNWLLFRRRRLATEGSKSPLTTIVVGSIGVVVLVVELIFRYRHR
jgi:hypothetical protein